MKKKQVRAQLILVAIGLFLFATTYLFYPNKNKIVQVEEEIIKKEIEKNKDDKQFTTFENLEYKGLYDFDKPFKVKSEKAYILNEEPDMVYMDKMHVILILSDGRQVNITSDIGKYNKKTYDCFFEQNVKATDGNTKILAENLDLLATNNSVEIYNSVSLDYATGYLEADKIDYNFETKYFKVSMYDDKSIKMKVIQ
jgi:Organic solvent tolerance protein OstA